MQRMSLTCVENTQQPANNTWQIQGPTLTWHFCKHPRLYTRIKLRDTIRK